MVCLLNAPEADQCLCSALANFVPKVLFDCHQCVPDMLHVLHDYSNSLCHPHLEDHPQYSSLLPSMITPAASVALVTHLSVAFTKS